MPLCTVPVLLPGAYIPANYGHYRGTTNVPGSCENASICLYNNCCYFYNWHCYYYYYYYYYYYFCCYYYYYYYCFVLLLRLELLCTINTRVQYDRVKSAPSPLARSLLALC